MIIQTYPTFRVSVYPAPITDPRRLLPLLRMKVSVKSYEALRAFQHVVPDDFADTVAGNYERTPEPQGDDIGDDSRHYNESSFDFAF